MARLKPKTFIMNQLSRRQLLTGLGAAAGAVLLNNCASKSSTNTPFQITPRDAVSYIPEIQSVRLGLIPSLESIPLLVAKNKKFFAKYGMTDVELVDFNSWQEICDRTEIGTDLGTSTEGIDGGHFYSPLPELLNEGIINHYSRKTAMYVLLRLHTHGGYIVVSKRLKPLGIQLKKANFLHFQSVAKLIGNPIKYAIAESGSNYDLWLRYWLVAMDIMPKQKLNPKNTDPKNIDILSIPLADIIPQVKQNRADLLCLDKWHTFKLSAANLAYPAIAIEEIWHNYPGEIFALRADWVDRYPVATQALIQAILEAQIWCDHPDNARELDNLIAVNFTDISNFTTQPVKMFSQLFKNSPHQRMGIAKIDKPRISPIVSSPIKYWSNDGVSVSYPYKSHDLWFLTEYQRWGLLPDKFEIRETIDAVNREDLWKNAAKAIGVADTNLPMSTSRGLETFFDGSIFDPKSPEKYLSNLML
jgi:ABC-type nitrate/sulfonate/bicarbonate transport system substrate-binding protein